MVVVETKNNYILVNANLKPGCSGIVQSENH